MNATFRPHSLTHSIAIHLNFEATSCNLPSTGLRNLGIILEVIKSGWSKVAFKTHKLHATVACCFFDFPVLFPFQKMSPQNPVVTVAQRAKADRTNCWQVLLMPGFEKWVWFTTGLQRPTFTAAGNRPYTKRCAFRHCDVTALLGSKWKQTKRYRFLLDRHKKDESND